MKRLAFIILLLAGAALATDIVFFDPVSTPVPNRVQRLDKSLNEINYIGATNALIVTNLTAQRGAGMNLANLSACVVDGQKVRLMTQAELDIIAATNALIAAAAEAQAKADARAFAKNVIHGTDGLTLYIRALAEANWFYLNQIRTNLNKPALSRTEFKNKIEENINALGQ